MKSSSVISDILLASSLVFILVTTGFNNKAIGKPVVDDVAIKGYDSVAYFKVGKALKGSESIAFQWHDMTWYFSTQENRDLFAADPSKYAPQYDGYCAWAMTEGRLAITNPEVWRIVNGKLYLNCSQAAYEKWSKDVSGNINKADIIWKAKYEKK
jgi:YHS domain-containing protein